MMKSSFLMSLSLCALSCSASFAQPPGGREGRPTRDGEQPREAGPRDASPREGGPREVGPGDRPRPQNPLMDALDPDHDRVISADEIKSAMAALLKLDKNGDGKLTEDEIRPQPAGAGFGPPPREGGAGPGRPPREADRPRDAAPREGAPPREADRPRDAAPREAAPRDGSEGPPRSEGIGPSSGFGPPEGRGPGGFGGPPDPARFIEIVMEFDANKDGLMSKEELMKFAEQGMRRRGGPGFPGGPGGPGGGNRPEGDRSDQERPARPGTE
jgi:Ca2+-binding EF-hand superfamily protein